MRTVIGDSVAVYCFVCLSDCWYAGGTKDVTCDGEMNRFFSRRCCDACFLGSGLQESMLVLDCSQFLTGEKSLSHVEGPSVLTTVCPLN